LQAERHLKHLGKYVSQTLAVWLDYCVQACKRNSHPQQMARRSAATRRSSSVTAFFASI
jgi:hypothetical protein